MKCWKVDGALQSSKLITSSSYIPKGVVIVVLGLSSSAMGICCVFLLRIIFDDIPYVFNESRSKLCEQAYQSWVRNHTNELKLPGLKYTPNQLFFISNANVLCGKSDSPLVGSHSPPMYRVIGAVSNLVEFATTFNCPSDSPMNPSKKCPVW
ncbi:endothelin-converting enzyme-like 1 [Stegodyphus dumicola]|uniref:endothelin-converting enzyme-like 1 n=1 Tax=Stegodyphus dumicola TaxID=202533 RepID=UPI0015A97383|nr:endothelin-converting enzyme-like 1 [Stegodyphus dumicola]